MIWLNPKNYGIDLEYTIIRLMKIHILKMAGIFNYASGVYYNILKKLKYDESLAQWIKNDV